MMIFKSFLLLFLLGSCPAQAADVFVTAALTAGTPQVSEHMKNAKSTKWRFLPFAWLFQPVESIFKGRAIESEEVLADLYAYVLDLSKLELAKEDVLKALAHYKAIEQGLGASWAAVGKLDKIFESLEQDFPLHGVTSKRMAKLATSMIIERLINFRVVISAAQAHAPLPLSRISYIKSAKKDWLATKVFEKNSNVQTLVNNQNFGGVNPSTERLVQERIQSTKEFVGKVLDKWNIQSPKKKSIAAWRLAKLYVFATTVEGNSLLRKQIYEGVVKEVKLEHSLFKQTGGIASTQYAFEDATCELLLRLSIYQKPRL